MEGLIDDIVSDFRQRFDDEPQLFSSPGRVNLIGEHTDYNEGFVLPFAIDERTYAACSKRNDRLVKVHTRTLDKSADLSLDEPPSTQKDWSLYVHGIASTVERRGVRSSGADIVIDSEIPFGAGLSSSAALEVCLGFALWSLTGGEPDVREIALAGQEVEHEFIGVRSGLMDQLASGFGRASHVLLIDCRTNEIEYVPIELDGHMLVICDTQVKHELAGTAYNKRRKECEEGVDLLAKEMGRIKSLRDVSISDLERYGYALPETIRKRCRHVVTENARVLAATSALRRKDPAQVGDLMWLSHDSLRDDYEVSCPELDLLVDTAAILPCVRGARMTGGGFGGCTINLIESEGYADFEAAIGAAYKKTFGRKPVISVVKPSDGVRREAITNEPRRSAA